MIKTSAIVAVLALQGIVAVAAPNKSDKVVAVAPVVIVESASQGNAVATKSTPETTPAEKANPEVAQSIWGTLLAMFG